MGVGSKHLDIEPTIHTFVAIIQIPGLSIFSVAVRHHFLLVVGLLPRHRYRVFFFPSKIHCQHGEGFPVRPSLISQCFKHELTSKFCSTGVTGYIGGDALYLISQKHPEWELTCLVRNSDKGAKVAAEYPGIHLVYGDLEAADLIEEEAKKADIVYRSSIPFNLTPII